MSSTVRGCWNDHSRTLLIRIVLFALLVFACARFYAAFSGPSRGSAPPPALLLSPPVLKFPSSQSPPARVATAGTTAASDCWPICDPLRAVLRSSPPGGPLVLQLRWPATGSRSQTPAWLDVATLDATSLAFTLPPGSGNDTPTTAIMIGCRHSCAASPWWWRGAGDWLDGASRSNDTHGDASHHGRTSIWVDPQPGTLLRYVAALNSKPAGLVSLPLVTGAHFGTTVLHVSATCSSALPFAEPAATELDRLIHPNAARDFFRCTTSMGTRRVPTLPGKAIIDLLPPPPAVGGAFGRPSRLLTLDVSTLGAALQVLTSMDDAIDAFAVITVLCQDLPHDSPLLFTADTTTAGGAFDRTCADVLACMGRVAPLHKLSHADGTPAKNSCAVVVEATAEMRCLFRVSSPRAAADRALGLLTAGLDAEATRPMLSTRPIAHSPRAGLTCPVALGTAATQNLTVPTR